jgi:NitT/TauT family transport system permease protein
MLYFVKNVTMCNFLNEPNYKKQTAKKIERRMHLENLWKYLTGILVIFITWTVLSFLISSQLILPDPLMVLKTLVSELQKSEVLEALVITLSKIGVVLATTVTFGVLIGFFIGLNDVVYDILRPGILVIQAVPIITWLALVMFIWGIGWLGPVIVSILSLLPHTILSTAIGIRTTDKRLIEMAKVYRVPRSKVIRNIYLGSIVPQLLSALQVIIGNVWKVVVVAEYMCGDKGIGVLIAWARQSVAVEKVYAYTAIIILIGLIVENILNHFVRKLLKNWELV